MRRLLFALILGASAVQAAPSGFNYGLHLFEEGDYYRAITELDRFRYFEPRAKDAEGALWLVAAAYLKGEKWEQAEKHFSEYAAAYPASLRAEAARFFAAESLYEARKLAQARQAYRVSLSGPFAFHARLRLASLSLVEGNWNDAAEKFTEAKTLQPSRLGELERWEKLSRQAGDFEPFSTGLVVLSSAIIPGSGQMECGYVYDGLSTLAMVGGFAAWAGFFFYNHQDTSGIVLSVASGVMYLANLHGAALAAKRANRDRPRALVKQVLDEIGESGAPEPDLRPWIAPQPK